MGVIKGDTRSLDYGSNAYRGWCKYFFHPPFNTKQQHKHWGLKHPALASFLRGCQDVARMSCIIRLGVVCQT